MALSQTRLGLRMVRQYPFLVVCKNNRLTTACRPKRKVQKLSCFVQYIFQFCATFSRIRSGKY
jgi:hypothetical protein